MKHLKVKTLVLGLIFILVGTGLLFARYGKGDGVRRYTANRYYNTDTEKTISGKIIKIQTVEGFGYRKYNSIQLIVKANTKTYIVHLGPVWYVNDKVKLKAGDKITITGSYTKINSKFLLLARELKRDGKIYQFRKKDGIPYWTGYGTFGRRR